MWTIIIVAVFWCWTRSSAGSVVEPVVGDATDLSSGSVVESAVGAKGAAANCWSGPFPSSVQLKVDKAKPPELHRSYPTITLYAPCLTRAYVNIAQEAEDANAFYFVQTSAIKKLVVQYHGEEPTTWHGDLEDEGKLLDFFTQVCLPKFGMITDYLAKEFCHNLDQPLVIFVPEPELDGPAVDSKYRGLFMQLRSKYADEIVFSHILPGMHPDWVANEFGVTSYPSMVVYKNYPGRPNVFASDWSQDSLLLFLQDVLAGCTDYKPHRASAAFMKKERLVRNAGQVLSQS